MAKFDESKVINALHKDKAVIGKKYWFAEFILTLKKVVEEGVTDKHLYELTGIDETSDFCFISDYENDWELIYPYEEPPKQRMTYRQLAEWLAKGNGEFVQNKDKYCLPLFSISYSDKKRNETVGQGIFIRTWDSEEWVEPTVDIYERDCKEVEKTNVGEKHD